MFSDPFPVTFRDDAESSATSRNLPLVTTSPDGRVYQTTLATGVVLRLEIRHQLGDAIRALFTGRRRFNVKLSRSSIVDAPTVDGTKIPLTATVNMTLDVPQATVFADAYGVRLVDALLSVVSETNFRARLIAGEV